MQVQLNGHALADPIEVVGNAFAPPTDVFDPEAIRVLTGAFEDAWKRLQASCVSPETERAQKWARDIIAKFIIEQARLGERDAHRLRDGALLQLNRSMSDMPRK